MAMRNERLLYGFPGIKVNIRFAAVNPSVIEFQ
jgi:hypothetical protein